MAYYGLSSDSAVSTLFNTSSDTYSLLQAASEYNSYRTLNHVVTSLKSGIASASSENEKTDLEDKLSTIMDTIKNHVPVSMTSQTLTQQAKEEANSILSSLGLGTAINTTV